MRTIGGFACLVLILLAGSVKRTDSSYGVARSPRSDNNPEIRLLQIRLKAIENSFASGDYIQAAAAAQAGYLEAERLHANAQALAFLNNLGSCRFALFQYRQAADAYLRARNIAEAIDDPKIILLDANLSSLYLKMNRLDDAAQALERSLKYLQRPELFKYRAKLLLQLGLIRAGQDRMAEAVQFFTVGIDSAYAWGDAGAAAQGWDRLGMEFLRRRQFVEADRSLTEGFRIRKLHRLRNLDSSYLNLGKLRLAQGDVKAASYLLNHAVSRVSSPDSLVSPYSIYYARGEARMAEHRVAEAFADFAIALDFARRWRLEILPADAARISSEIGLHHLYSSFIEAGNQLYFDSGRKDLATRTFAAVEEDRAASLRELLAGPADWRTRLPAEYWQSLAQLRALEAQGLRRKTAEVDPAVTRLRAQMTEAEIRAGSREVRAIRDIPDHYRRSMDSESVLLSFHLGTANSFLWALSQNGFQLCRLPAKSTLIPEISRFADAVRAHDSDALSLGHALYQTLFGGLQTSLAAKPRWILALDEQLFTLPFAALVVRPHPAGGVYLTELHSIQITSGALLLNSGGPGQWRTPSSGPFVGVGDAIYNTADDRWASQRRAAFSQGSWPAVLSARQSIPLARLAGSRREIEECARAWNPDGSATLLLRGADVSRQALQAAYRANPSIIHFATHVIESSESGRHGLIALSLSKTGQPEFLGPLEITAYPVSAGLVVLSGCSSGRAEALPGEGLMGLTRAWLAAGAHAVAASHWPTPDDDDGLFIRFYQHLRQFPQSGPAAALQRAQIDMLRSGGWRSGSDYWASYFVLGNS